MQIPSNYHEKQKKIILVVSGFALIGLIGFLDFLTGYEISFSVFYVLPIALIVWVETGKAGIIACLISAFVWFIADKTTGHSYSNPIIPYWNSLIRFTYFITITFLLSELKKSLHAERELSRTDYLTDAVNSRYFYEIAQMEINRSKRRGAPLTVVYLDLDNFKEVNDKLGHSSGDQVLQTVVRSIKSKIRITDTVARLGGDEFAMVFPETEEKAARTIIDKIRAGLLDEMNRNYWPITLSFGVVSCKIPPDTIDEMLKIADNLMYSAKLSGRNAVKYSKNFNSKYKFVRV